MYRLLVLLLFVAVSASAQQKVDIKELAFMQGRWVLQHQWGDMEEFWSVPMGNNIMSTYRCVKDGKIVFYEFMVIEQTDSVPVLRLRHFNPGSIGWEDKEHPYAYPLIKIEKNKAVFESTSKDTKLVYQKESAEKMTVLLLQKKEDKWETETFNYTLAKP